MNMKRFAVEQVKADKNTKGTWGYEGWAIVDSETLIAYPFQEQKMALSVAGRCESGGLDVRIFAPYHPEEYRIIPPPCEPKPKAVAVRKNKIKYISVKLPDHNQSFLTGNYRKKRAKAVANVLLSRTDGCFCSALYAELKRWYEVHPQS